MPVPSYTVRLTTASCLPATREGKCCVGKAAFPPERSRRFPGVAGWEGRVPWRGGCRGGEGAVAGRMPWRGGCRGGEDAVAGRVPWRGGCRGGEDAVVALWLVSAPSA